MKLVRWMRFTWDLTKLPAPKSEMESHYLMRVATQDDEESVRRVITSAFSLDMDWSDTLKNLRDHFESQIDRVFVEKEVPCVVVLHGTRIIGASALDTAKTGRQSSPLRSLHPERVPQSGLGHHSFAQFASVATGFRAGYGRTALPSTTCPQQNSSIQNSIQRVQAMILSRSW